jgi:Homeodomain-like domain
MRPTNGTNDDKKLHGHALSVAQLSAVDLLAAGKNDREVAELLGLARPTVTKWRLYHPEIIAALNQRRAEVWGSGIDRLRSLIPKALDVMARFLEAGAPAVRVRAAAIVLSLAKLPAPAPAGPTTPEAVISALAAARVKAKQAERHRHLGELDRLLAAERIPPEQAERDEREAAEEIAAELQAHLSEEAGG